MGLRELARLKIGIRSQEEEYYRDGLKLGVAGLKGRSRGALAGAGQAGPGARTRATGKLSWGRRRKGGGMVVRRTPPKNQAEEGWRDGGSLDPSSSSTPTVFL